MPEDPKPETKAPEAPAETPAQPQVTNEQLAAAVREANWRAIAAERQAALAASEAARISERQPRPPRVDPLEKFANESLTMSPDEQKRALAAAIREGAQEEVNKMRGEVEGRLQMERSAMESKVALDMVLASRPELSDPKNGAGFAASLTKAKYEADSQGINLSPAELARRAGQIYDEVFRPKNLAPVPPRLEGQGRPDLNPFEGMEIVSPQSALEKQYGQKKGTIREMYNPNDGDAVDKINLEYIRGKNAPLLKKGVVTNLDTIRFQSEDPATGQ